MILKEQKYLDAIISSMPEAEEVHLIEKHIENYLNGAEFSSQNRYNKL
jgi:hypothetical protein